MIRRCRELRPAPSQLGLIQRQELFLELLPLLLLEAGRRGYRVTAGELWRHPEATHGSRRSLHPYRLAVDLNLFRGPDYLEETADHKPLGDFWRALHPLCRWGGDPELPSGGRDGNHYSIAWTIGGREVW